jgi:Uma2 family endonuclease
MSTAAALSSPPPPAPPTSPATARAPLTIVIGNAVRIPPEVVDQESFRRWAKSDEFPERARAAFLDGTLWVDPSMEQAYTHNQVKAAFTFGILGLLQSLPLGRYFPDGMLLSHLAAGLSTIPDGIFISYATLRSGLVRQVPGAAVGTVEFEGTPDMVLEVVSETSVVKDTIDLPRLCWRAGIPEYWLVDAREEPLRFDLFKRRRKAYTATRRQAGGWLKSAVFGRSFRLTRQVDPLGDPQYTLEVRG